MPVDHEGRKPHQREHARAVLERIGGARARQLERIFDSGLDQNSSFRWQSIDALRSELATLAGDRVVEQRTFEEVLMDLRARAESVPQVRRRQRLQETLEAVSKLRHRNLAP